MSLRPWPLSLRTRNKHLLSTGTSRRSAADLNRRGRARGGDTPRRGFFGAEELESRMLLTTLIGGEEFIYLDNSLPGDVDPGTGQIVRISLEGNIRVEIVGASVTGNNTAEVANLAGLILGPGGDIREVFGGIGGPGGIDIIGPVFTNTGIPDINAIAANPAGLMYAIQIV